LDIRNKRNVAHVGGEVDPNYSDSLLVCHCADRVLVERIRNYHTNPIDQAKAIAAEINETRIPLVAEVDGFIRIQNTNLTASEQALVVLYYKHPYKVRDIDLIKWTRYENPSRFRSQILKALDTDALIHYEVGICALLPKGILHVEKTIKLDLLI
jgi:hypothetical protein